MGSTYTSARENLLNFFSGGPLPVVQGSSRARSDFSDEDPVRAKTEMLKEYQAQDEEFEYQYVKRYREEERRKINEINKELKNGGYKSKPASEEMKPFRPKNWRRNRDMSVDDTNVAEEESPKKLWEGVDPTRKNINVEDIPIYAVKEKILTAVKMHQVTIIEGFTGCGKTTQVPQYILDDAVQRGAECKIVVTQPRRIGAISIAKRVCWERRESDKLGGLIGYQIGMDCTVSEDTRLTFVTTGVLLQSLIHRKTLNQYTHIIIDEVHERDLETDLLMLVVKRLMVETKDFKTRVILMSATIDTEAFKQYFPTWDCPDMANGTTSIKIPPFRPHPVTEHYLDNLESADLRKKYLGEFGQEPNISPDLYDAAASVIVAFDTLEKNEKRYRPASVPPSNSWDETEAERGAVLVFLPGLFEIDSMMAALHTMEREKAGHVDNVDVLKWTIYPLHSMCTHEEQQQVFNKAPKGRRKIILATNIAESSITVTDIKYVIDFCLTKNLCADRTTNYTSLRLEWASKNQCIQRKGRCGRVSPGHVYRMVPKTFWNALPREAPSEMKRSCLENVVLRIKKLAMGSPKAMLALAMDPPKLSGIQLAVANLKEVGALTVETIIRGRTVVDNCDGDVTYLGEVISSLPIDVRLGRLIMLGYVFGLLEETIIIAAGLSTKSPFSHPFNRRVHAYMSKLYWAQNAYSDCFALINLYRTWDQKFRHCDFRDGSLEQSWAKQYLVQKNVMREMTVAILDIKKRLLALRINVDAETPSTPDEHKWFLLKIVIAGAFYPNFYLRREPPDIQSYSHIVKRELANRKPETTVVFQNFPADQPVELYAATVAAPFQEPNIFQQGTIPEVEADGEKLLLSFDERGHKIGNICHGVYRAIKMRQLREVFTLRVMQNPEQAKDTLSQAMRELSVSRKMLKAPPQVDPKTIRQRSLDVWLTHVDSPTEFYVIRDSDKEVMEKLVQCMEVCKRQSYRTIRREEISSSEGSLVFIGNGKTIDRARIESVQFKEKGNVTVGISRIDMGGLFWKSIAELHVIDPNIEEASFLYETPGLAIRCRLSNLSPLAIHDGRWLAKSVNEMKSLEDSSYKFQVYSVIGSVMAGDLLLANDVSIREKLITDGLAEEGIEEPDSIRDNEYRCQNDGNSPSTLPGNSKAIPKEPKPFIQEELYDHMTRPVILRGPFSPLEMTFSAVCKNTGSGTVVIDGSSVNCVALEQNPWNPVTRLLVAGSVNLSQKTQKLHVRDTTLLPPIVGLPSLLTVIFAPKAEFRVSEDGKRCTGVLAGLGADPVTKDAVYPDHDVEMAFDIKITKDDIEKINGVRLGMNYILRPDSHKELKNLRDQVIEQLLKVIHRPRKKVVEELYRNEHCWNDYSDDLEILVPQEKLRIRHTDVFQFHNAFDLKKEEEALVFVTRSLGFNKRK